MNYRYIRCLDDKLNTIISFVLTYTKELYCYAIKGNKYFREFFLYLIGIAGLK